MSERSTKRDEPVDPSKGRDIPRGTDEHAESDEARGERERAAQSAPAKPDELRDRATPDE